MYKPLGHRVLVMPQVIEEKTEGGIYIPQQVIDHEKAGVDKGVVVAIGSTCWPDSPPWCDVGDTVIWARYAGKPVWDADTLYHLLNDEDILAVDCGD